MLEETQVRKIVLRGLCRTHGVDFPVQGCDENVLSKTWSARHVPSFEQEAHFLCSHERVWKLHFFVCWRDSHPCCACWVGHERSLRVIAQRVPVFALGPAASRVPSVAGLMVVALGRAAVESSQAEAEVVLGVSATVETQSKARPCDAALQSTEAMDEKHHPRSLVLPFVTAPTVPLCSCVRAKAHCGVHTCGVVSEAAKARHGKLCRCGLALHVHLVTIAVEVPLSLCLLAVRRCVVVSSEAVPARHVSRLHFERHPLFVAPVPVVLLGRCLHAEGFCGERPCGAVSEAGQARDETHL